MGDPRVVWGSYLLQFESLIMIPRCELILPQKFYHYEHNEIYLTSPLKLFHKYSLYNGKTKIRVIDDTIPIEEIKLHFEYLKLKYN
jgi:hypothetical protein